MEQSRQWQLVRALAPAFFGGVALAGVLGMRPAAEASLEIKRVEAIVEQIRAGKVECVQGEVVEPGVMIPDCYLTGPEAVRQLSNPEAVHGPSVTDTQAIEMFDAYLFHKKKQATVYGVVGLVVFVGGLTGLSRTLAYRNS